MEWLFDDVHLLCPADNIDRQGALWISEGRIKALLTTAEAHELRHSWGSENPNRKSISFSGSILTPMFSDILSYVGVPSAMHRED